MDGCHDVKLFFRIIFPIAKPVIVTMALIKAIGCWNDFYMPMILLGKEEHHDADPWDLSLCGPVYPIYE